MSTTPNDSCYIFVVDTDKYAGNFERPMCAYMTGTTGDCEVGSEEARQFENEYDGIFDDIIMQVADEHGCYRPVTAWPTPGWGNDGMGKHERLTEENAKKFHYPAYMSVAIFFQEKPSQEIIDVMKKRAYEYIELYKKDKYGGVITISGFRLIKHDVEIKQTEEVV